MGLHQGDPLSLLLFILCSKTLSRLLDKEKTSGNLHGIKVSSNAPAITYLIYADHLVICGCADGKEAIIFQDCFQKYCKWSGQEVNLEKSSILNSKFTPRSDKREVINITGFKKMGHSSIYLGNSFVMGHNTSKEFIHLKDRVRCRLEGWNRQLLSKAGKATLISSVIQAIPAGVLDSMVKLFWWNAKKKEGRYLALKAWSEICKPKTQGGLGFRKFSDFNTTLLAKLAWKMESMDKAPWARMFCAKYLKGQSLFEYLYIYIKN